MLAGCREAAVTPTPGLPPEVAAGQQLFSEHCAACHALSEEMIIVGPSLAGISQHAGERQPGQDARQYILNSILNPSDYIVEGFDNSMPSSFGRRLSGEEIDALVAFLLTQ